MCVHEINSPRLLSVGQRWRSTCRLSATLATPRTRRRTTRPRRWSGSSRASSSSTTRSTHTSSTWRASVLLTDCLSVSRVFVSCKMFRKDALCIVEGKHAWRLCLDVVCLSREGNLTDASILAAVVALSDVKLPLTTISTDDKVFLVKGEGVIPSLCVVECPNNGCSCGSPRPAVMRVRRGHVPSDRPAAGAPDHGADGRGGGVRPVHAGGGPGQGRRDRRDRPTGAGEQQETENGRASEHEKVQVQGQRRTVGRVWSSLRQESRTGGAEAVVGAVLQVCAFMKPGGPPLSAEQVKRCLEISKERWKEMHQILWGGAGGAPN